MGKITYWKDGAYSEPYKSRNVACRRTHCQRRGFVAELAEAKDSRFEIIPVAELFSRRFFSQIPYSRQPIRSRVQQFQQCVQLSPWRCVGFAEIDQ
jgi:hypothetical protein